MYVSCLCLKGCIYLGLEWDIPKVHIEKEVLSNSLRVIFCRKDYLTVTFRILSRHGYRNETFPESVHLLEHMLFKPEERVFPIFQKIGGDINGYVSTDEFSIYWNVPKIFQDKAVDAVDRIINENKKHWTKDMLEREKRVIVREIGENYSDPKPFLNIFLRKKLFGEDTPGTHSPQEIEKVFREVTLEDVRREVEYLAPENSVLSSVGETTREVVERLDDWTGRSPEMKSLKPQPDYGLHIADREILESYISIGWISPPRSSVEAEILSLMGTILTAFPTSRLYKELRVKRGLVYFVGAMNVPYVDTGYFLIYTMTTPQNVGKVLEIIKEQIQKIINEGPTEEELDDMKNMFFGALYNLTDSKLALSSVLAYNELFYNDALRTYTVAARRVQELRIEDVIRAAKRYLDPDKAVICIVGEKSKIDIK